MASDAWDHYKTEVLAPARQAGNVPPRDLFVRYAMSGAHRTGDRFEERITETVRYWRKLAVSTKVYKPLAEALLAAHEQLRRDGALTVAAFTARVEEERSRADATLEAWVTGIAAGIPYVTRAAVAHLVELTGGITGEAEVRAKLSAGGVRVIDPDWDVPGAAPVGTAGALGPSLKLLGHRLSVQAVFTPEQLAGGFRLKDGFRLVGGDGSRLTRRAVEKAKAELATRSRDSRLTAADTVLTMLLNAEAAGALDRLVLWEVVQSIRSTLAGGMPPRVAADMAAALGLDREEALELTVAVAGGPGAAADPADDGALITAALAGQRLREAEALLAGLADDAATADVRARVRQLAEQVATLDARATEAERDGRPEEAARLLADAVRLAADDEGLTGRLARIPPPPPGAVRAGPDGDRVTISWTHSAAESGEITYRVIRTGGRAAIGPDDGDQVAGTVANHAVDPAPPVASSLVYTVFAQRGAAVSAGTAAPPVRVLPPVSGFELTGTERRVTGTWQLPPAAVDVVVMRRTDGAETVVAHRPGAVTAFADDDVRLGAAYEYRVTPVYPDPDTGRVEGPSVICRVVVEPAPEPVTDLTVDVVTGTGTPRTRLTWTVPPAGRVEIRQAAAEPPWPPGTVVSARDVDGHGQACGVVPSITPDGRAEAVLPAVQGRSVLTAVTRGQGRAVIGTSVPVELSAVVRGLRLRRQWDTVLVGWIWPDGIQEARLEWSTPDGGGELSCSRRAFLDDGGVRLPVGPRPVTVSVRTVVRQRHTETVSPAVAGSVPARPPRVRWALRAAGRWPVPRRVLLRLRSDQACQLPELVLSVGARELGRVRARPLPAEQDLDEDVTALVPPDAVNTATCTLAEPDAVLLEPDRRRPRS
ncbi:MULTISPECIES: bacterial transcriptional activator domain-containing protein [Catenuloplanes]|uniref:SaeA first Fn3-like domain-containing protein n=1 Tax=Catenuloplanes niger TaxID=587534 RepID=A0AAE4CXJ9_9ACTN|nr:bacterial transcriptional activator domain-containing protein [Catenuloplanes niger]MDR7328285.1 hypothetical protein [Catenuloplanes niger]